MKLFIRLIWLIKFLVNYYYNTKEVKLKPFNKSYMNCNNIDKNSNNQSNINKASTIRKINPDSNLRYIIRDQRALVPKNPYKSKTSFFSSNPWNFTIDSRNNIQEISNPDEIRIINTNQPSPFQSSRPSYVNLSRGSTQLGKNEICLREIDNTMIRGNQHNSENWNYVFKFVKRPNTTIYKDQGSVAELSKILSEASIIVAKNEALIFKLRINHIAYNMRQNNL